MPRPAGPSSPTLLPLRGEGRGAARGTGLPSPHVSVGEGLGVRGGRLGLLLLGLLFASGPPAAELSADGLAVTVDPGGRVVDMMLNDRPAPLLPADAWSLWDEQTGLDETYFLGFNDRWPDDSAYRGPMWRMGLDWTRIEAAAGEPPAARFTASDHVDADALRLVFPAVAQGVFELRLRVRKEQFRGTIRAGVVPLNAVGQVTGAVVRFEGPPEPAPDGAWDHLTCTVAPPPTTAFVQVWVSLDAAVGTLEVAGLEVTVHAGGEKLPLEGRLAADGAGARYRASAGELSLTAVLEPVGEALRARCRVATSGRRERVVTLRFALPIDGSDWLWWTDLNRSSAVAKTAGRLYAHWRQLGGGHLISPYPVGCLTRTAPGQGLALAVPPAQAVLTRFAFRQEEGLTVEFDLGLAPELAQSAAEVEFAVFAVNPAWGLRSALDRLYALYGTQMASTSPRAGAWFTALNPDAAPDPARFGLLFDEQAGDHLAWSRAHQLVSLASAMPWGTFARPGGAALVAADGLYPTGPVGRERMPAGGTLRDAEGRPVQRLLDDGTRYHPWCTDPDFSTDGPAGAINAALASKLQGRDGKPLGGLHLDGIGAAWSGWQTEDFAPEHLRAADLPLSTSPTRRRPAVYTAIGHVELLRDLAGRLRRRGQILLGSLDESAPLPFVVPWLDVLGAGETRPSYEHLMWLRAVAYHKPITFLDPLLLDPALLYEEQYRLWHRALLWGAFPGGVGWLDGRRIRTQEPLFNVYVPVLRSLAAAGWEPVPHALTSDVNVRLERYGYRDELYLVIDNSTDTGRQVTITIEPRELGLVTTAADGTPERRLLFVDRLSRDKKAIEFRIALDRWQTSLSIPARTLRVLTPYKVDLNLDLFAGLTEGTP